MGCVIGGIIGGGNTPRTSNPNPTAPEPTTPTPKPSPAPKPKPAPAPGNPKDDDDDDLRSGWQFGKGRNQNYYGGIEFEFKSQFKLNDTVEHLVFRENIATKR